ncbi:hypothetical protein [Catellatospora sp. IY07-71]|uniref:hypothetical protein n=1 Tax=Catellatospora sp. IY07-71 TaxID=2728827 RepID=UPI001BB3F801|nr:hypothetical protein [Catellatospora sp. IY07-71]
MADQTSPPAWVPQACTLPTAERPFRLAEFDALFARATGPGDRVTDRHLRLLLSGGPDVAAEVIGLAARESECCSFFTFTVIVDGPGRLRLDIEVPAVHVDVLDAIAERATVVGGAR